MHLNQLKTPIPPCSDRCRPSLQSMGLRGVASDRISKSSGHSLAADDAFAVSCKIGELICLMRSADVFFSKNFEINSQ